jgi:hypothetical protein
LNSNAITALATGLLVVVGAAQYGILIAQQRQHRLQLAEMYWRRWADCRPAWAILVFVGRDPNAYYQVADADTTKLLRLAVKRDRASRPSTWAVD